MQSEIEARGELRPIAGMRLVRAMRDLLRVEPPGSIAVNHEGLHWRISPDGWATVQRPRSDSEASAGTADARRSRSPQIGVPGAADREAEPLVGQELISGSPGLPAAKVLGRTARSCCRSARRSGRPRAA